MAAQAKAYKGLPMEGFTARWYASSTARHGRRFRDVSRAVAARAAPGAHVLEVAPGPGAPMIAIGAAPWSGPGSARGRGSAV